MGALGNREKERENIRREREANRAYLKHTGRKQPRNRNALQGKQRPLVHGNLALKVAQKEQRRNKSYVRGQAKKGVFNS